YLKAAKLAITPAVSLSPLKLAAVVDLTGLEIGVGNVASVKDPKFAGRAAGPVQVGSLHGEVPLGREGVNVEHLAIESLKAALNKATYDAPDGISFAADAAALRLNLSEAKASGELSINRGVVAFSGSTEGSAAVEILKLSFNGSRDAASGDLRLASV